VILGALVISAGAASFFSWKSYPAIFAASEALRVATIPVNDIGRTFLSALKREIASQHARVQLSLVETPSVWASAQALKQQQVDAAVVRSDDPAVADGRALFILRSLYAAVLVAEQSPVDGISKLKGRKIGVVADDAGVDPMAKVVLDFYGFDAKQVVRLSAKDLAPALRRRQLAAVLVVGPSGAGPIAEAIEAFRKTTKQPPRFLDLAEASAIAERYAAYDEAEINAGAFSGSPAVPSEKVTTISANVLLVAQAALSNSAAGEITRLLLATKSRVAATLPEAGQLAVPSTEKDELLPAHPGTVAYLNGEQSNLLDDTTNWIILGSMLTGFVGSLGAWLKRVRNKKKADEPRPQARDQAVQPVPANASVAAQLGAIENGLDALSQWLTQKFSVDEAAPQEFQKVAAKLAAISSLAQEKLAPAKSEPASSEPGQQLTLRLVEAPAPAQAERAPRQPVRLVAIERSDRAPADAA
jgi:TRAP transporter TAXI family solute receptor